MPDGHTWNHKRVYRVYKQLALHLRRKGKERLPSRALVTLEKQLTINKCWALGFMSDALFSEQRFRAFNVIDNCSREALAIEMDTNLPTARVIHTLDPVAAWRGYPLKLRMDNGPECISIKLAAWAEEHGIELEFTQPGNLHKIHILNDLTVRFGKKFYIFMFLKG